MKKKNALMELGEVVQSCATSCGLNWSVTADEKKVRVKNLYLSPDKLEGEWELYKLKRKGFKFFGSNHKEVLGSRLCLVDAIDTMFSEITRDGLQQVLFEEVDD